MRKLEYYWKTNRAWYDYDENLNVYIKDDAPQEAKDSFKKYLEQKKATEAAD